MRNKLLCVTFSTFIRPKTPARSVHQHVFQELTVDRQHFHFVPFLRRWRAADSREHPRVLLPWRWFCSLAHVGPVVTQTPTAGRCRPSSQWSTELQEENMDLKLDFRSNKLIKSDLNGAKLQNQSVSIISTRLNCSKGTLTPCHE